VADLQALNPAVDIRPWGWFTVLGEPDHDPIAAVKILHVEPGQMLSLQTHQLRRERWIPTTQGLGAVIGDQEIELLLGHSYEVPIGVPHRLFDVRGSGGSVIEIMYGTYDEDDIIRLNDMYQR
jgi:mannose-6-phosphate isomerase